VAGGVRRRKFPSGGLNRRKLDDGRKGLFHWEEKVSPTKKGSGVLETMLPQEIFEGNRKEGGRSGSPY